MLKFSSKKQKHNKRKGNVLSDGSEIPFGANKPINERHSFSQQNGSHLSLQQNH